MNTDDDMACSQSSNGGQVRATDPDFANETGGFNLIPFASMAGGWLGPLLMFWLYVWGPLRPFHYPSGDLLPPLPMCFALFAACIAVWWAVLELPRSARSNYVYVMDFDGDKIRHVMKIWNDAVTMKELGWT